MRVKRLTLGFGWRVYGLGIMTLAFACLVFGDFLPGQTVPNSFPARTVLAYVAGAFMFIAAAAIEWRRTIIWGAAALTGYYVVFVVLLMNGRLLLADYAIYGTYEEITMQLALAATGLIVFATAAQIDVQIDAALAARLARVGQLTFGICTLTWGGAHFVYMNLTAPLVPKWLPPGQVFWGFVTGVCFIAAGLAILTGIKARLAAILLTVMIASFGVLANGRMLVANHSSHWNWTESALNLALIGGAWVVADSLDGLADG
jgi:uncharacterized membrane protein